MSFSLSRLSGALTIRPLVSLMNFPEGRGIGPPALLPTPIIINCLSALLVRLNILSICMTSARKASSVNHTIFAWLIPLFFNSAMALLNAAIALLPMLGMISGDSDGISAAIVLASSVRGETVWASPE